MSSLSPIHEFPTGKKLILYHANWATYARNFQIKDLPIQFITDINYAFLDLQPCPCPRHQNRPDWLVPTLTDKWADTDKRFTQPGEGVPPPDAWTDGTGPEDTFYGNFGQLMKLKGMGIKFNVGMSIGGWTLSKRFSDAVKRPSEREAFVDGILEIMDKYPGLFNRVDIDWEYISPPHQNYGAPGNAVRAEDPANFGMFLAMLRQKLDATGKRACEISACVTGDPAKMDVLPVREMGMYLDTINVMTYDFASSAWGPCPAGHQTNLYATPYAALSVHGAISHLLSLGLPAHKLVIGAAAYSRGFANTAGLGHPSQGTVEDQSWEAGVCDLKTLPRPGAQEYWDEQARASYSYDPTRRTLNSYDTPRSVAEKCRYVWERDLRGVIVWESSGDYGVQDERRSIVRGLWAGLARDPRT
ncbi:glycoside hydrolase [Phlyctochytrium arcticum]|nr:glycoside hydrolase [Phlyctochytrium arcticum]